MSYAEHSSCSEVRSHRSECSLGTRQARWVRATVRAPPPARPVRPARRGAPLEAERAAATTSSPGKAEAATSGAAPTGRAAALRPAAARAAACRGGWSGRGRAAPTRRTVSVRWAGQKRCTCPRHAVAMMAWQGAGASAARGSQGSGQGAGRRTSGAHRAGRVCSSCACTAYHASRRPCECMAGGRAAAAWRVPVATAEGGTQRRSRRRRRRRWSRQMRPLPARRAAHEWPHVTYM